MCVRKIFFLCTNIQRCASDLTRMRFKSVIGCCCCCCWYFVCCIWSKKLLQLFAIVIELFCIVLIWWNFYVVWYLYSFFLLFFCFCWKFQNEIYLLQLIIAACGHVYQVSRLFFFCLSIKVFLLLFSYCFSYLSLHTYIRCMLFTQNVRFICFIYRKRRHIFEIFRKKKQKTLIGFP